jgi:hypothetical protein
MKKLFNFFNVSLFVWIMIISSDKIWSQQFNWNGIVPNPCSFNDTTSWRGPKDTIICIKDSNLCFHPNSCCFTVVYYDRWAGSQKNKFELSIAGIFWRDLYQCCITDQSALLKVISEKLIKVIALKEPGFKNKVLSTSDSTTMIGDFTNARRINTYSFATCETDGILCDSNKRCCKLPLEICFNEPTNPKVVSGTASNWPIWMTLEPDSACPEGCTKSCFQFATGKDPRDTVNPVPYVKTCEGIPCIVHDWYEAGSGWVPVDPSCPNCKINIFYHYGKGINCNPSYWDLSLDSVAVDPSCKNCPSISEEFVFRFAMNWVLKYGAHTSIGQNECDTSYRVVFASCWNFTQDTLLFIPCSGDSQCCVKRYVVCRDNSYNYTYSLLESISTSVPLCNQITRPCKFMCDQNPMPKVPTDEKESQNANTINRIYTKPNPANDNIEICYFSDFRGVIELEVHSMQGDLILTRKVNKNQIHLYIPLDLKNINNGIYLFNLKAEGQIIAKDKFIILK